MPLKQIIEDTDTRAGQAFDLAIQLLIVLSLITFSLETMPGLAEAERYWLHIAEMVTVALFTVEYCLRVLVASRKRAFVFSFFGIIDLLAILPFYLTTGLDLRSLRAFRMVRLVRVLKLARYSAAMQRFAKAIAIAKEEMLLFMFIAFLLIFLAAAGIYHCEHNAQPEKFRSIFDGLWWAICTLTTVGYGDVYPITVGGRLFTFVLLLIGLGIVAVPAGILASALTSVREQENRQ
ncbi:MAG: ion transporter [Planctomycetes bacterium]|nr:ion transporter [Planctomycetota bacterium]